jgi:hypothetical protein
MSIKNTISNKSAAFLLFGLVISLAFVQLYQSNHINGANNVKEGLAGFNSAKITDANANIMSEIQSLKDIEGYLYNQIDDLKAGGTLDDKTLNEYIAKIANVDSLRVKLYNNLINNYGIYQDHVINKGDYAADIKSAADIVTDTYQSTESIENEQKNAQRYVEVNTYYAKRYNYLTDIVKIIIYICIVMIILSSLANNGLIPEWLYSWALVILLVFGLYFLGKKIFLLFNVDNMNFDRYDWHFTPPTTATTTTA